MSRKLNEDVTMYITRMALASSEMFAVFIVLKPQRERATVEGNRISWSLNLKGG